MRKIIYTILQLLLFFGILISCKEDEYSIPELEPGLHNDCIKRSLSPNVVGQFIEFAYAMALKPEEGKLLTATVEASIAGATGTYLENKSYYTNMSGVDVGIEIGEPSVTVGNRTTVTFNKDTCAATLRYYYKIPEEARGKTVNLNFTATASNKETVSYKMGPYEIRNMDIILDLVASDGNECFISIADMAVYDAATASANAANIDLVYLYRSIPNITFNHSLVSPSANDTLYLPDVDLPSGVNNKSKVIKAWNIQDQQLARLQYGKYVDDLDLQKVDFSTAADFAINLKAEAGIWVETQDGKYRAYIFINRTNNSLKTMTLSIKRLKVK